MIATHLNCPACRKQNTLEHEPFVCTRCGCDLAGLVAISRSAHDLLRLAHTHLTHQDWPGALSHASLSWQLRHSPQAARLAALAAFGLDRPSLVHQWLTLLTRSEPA